MKTAVRLAVAACMLGVAITLGIMHEAVMWFYHSDESSA